MERQAQGNTVGSTANYWVLAAAIAASVAYLRLAAAVAPPGAAALPALVAVIMLRTTPAIKPNAQIAISLVLVGLAGLDLARLPPWAAVVQAVIWIGAVVLVDEWDGRGYARRQTPAVAALGAGLGVTLAVMAGVSATVPATPLALCLAWAAARWFGHRVTLRAGPWAATATALWLPAMFFTTWWGGLLVVLEIGANALIGARAPAWLSVLHSSTVWAAFALWLLR